MEFEKKLKDLRLANYMTQEELATKSGIPLKMIESYEKGRHYPSRENMYKLADALNVKVYELFSDLDYDAEAADRSLQIKRFFIYGTGGTAVALLIAFIVVFSVYYWKGTASVVAVFTLGALALLFLATYDVLILAMLKRRREKMILSISVNLLMILAASAAFLVNLAAFQNHIAYTEEKWQEVEPEYKLYMAQDFVETHNVLGLSSTQIKNYLGVPETINGPDFEDYTFYIYDLGQPVRKSYVRNYTLTFAFYKDKVKYYTIVDR